MVASSAQFEPRSQQRFLACLLNAEPQSKTIDDAVFENGRELYVVWNRQRKILRETSQAFDE